MTKGANGWEAVRDYVYRLSAGSQTGPTPGSTEWCDLADDDPAKLGGLVRVGSLWVLENDLNQIDQRRQAIEDANSAISQALDWARVAKRIRDRDDFYRHHPDLRRRAS